MTPSIAALLGSGSGGRSRCGNDRWPASGRPRFSASPKRTRSRPDIGHDSQKSPSATTPLVLTGGSFFCRRRRESAQWELREFASATKKRGEPNWCIRRIPIVLRLPIPDRHVIKRVVLADVGGVGGHALVVEEQLGPVRPAPCHRLEERVGRGVLGVLPAAGVVQREEPVDPVPRSLLNIQRPACL